MTDNIIQNEKIEDLKKDNGLFDDVWDIKTHDDKRKEIINTIHVSEKSNTISDNDWDSLLDYYEPSRKEKNKSDQIKHIDQNKYIDQNKPTTDTLNTNKSKTQKTNLNNTKQSIKSKKQSTNYDDEYDEYDDEYDDTYDNTYDDYY